MSLGQLRNAGKFNLGEKLKSGWILTVSFVAHPPNSFTLTTLSRVIDSPTLQVYNDRWMIGSAFCTCHLFPQKILSPTWQSLFIFSKSRHTRRHTHVRRNATLKFGIFGIFCVFGCIRATFCSIPLCTLFVLFLSLCHGRIRAPRTEDRYRSSSKHSQPLRRIFP